MVVWRSGSPPIYGIPGQDGDLFGVFGQRFTSSATPIGAEFQVNTYTTNYQGSFGMAPGLAMESDGDFVVVWSSNAVSIYGQDGSADGVFAQRFSSGGTKLAAEFMVHSYTNANQTPFAGVVSSDADGDFVVVWSSSAGQDGASYGVFGQRFASDGARVGTDFQINLATAGAQRRPAVSVDADGDFVVVWESSDGNGDGIWGRRFTSAGVGGNHFLVNSFLTGTQRDARVSSRPAGDFVVVWQDNQGEDGDYPGVFGQRFTSIGLRIGVEFQVNSYSTSYQLMPDVAVEPGGNFMVVWHSDGQDNSGFGLFSKLLQQRRHSV